MSQPLTFIPRSPISGIGDGWSPPWSFRQTPLCPTPLVPDKWQEGDGASSGKSLLGQGWGERWAQGSQQAAGTYPPTTDSSGKEDRGVARETSGAVLRPSAESEFLVKISGTHPLFPWFLVSCPCISCLRVPYSTSQSTYLLIPTFWRNTEDAVAVSREDAQYPLLLTMLQWFKALRELTDP